MPTDCNALVRLDKKLEFCKINCKWGFVRQGRPRASEKPKSRSLTKKKRVKNPHTLCMTIEKKHYDYIRKMALIQSQQEGKILHANDLIRDALIRAFPVPEIYDLFGDKK